MWMLKDTKGSIKYLKPNKTIKVGRKDADIILENDSSISRAHASITVTLKEQVQTSEESSICLIKDINSKYGSFIVRNGSKLKVSKEGLELHHGDTLTFGLQNCTYSVEYIHIVTVISRLNADDREKLKSIMDEIGGLIISSYNSHCTHLTASIAATTTKIISSLINCIPIVGINYWIQVRKCIEDDKILPDLNFFVLSLQDAGVDVRRVSLKPNPLRKTLFQKKTFIFFTEKSCKEYKEMIQQAGGAVKVQSMSPNIPDNLFSNNYIIMKVATNDSSAEELLTFDTLLQNKMKEKKLRTVNETEIPLAIIYASLDQYCNPEYDFMKLFKRKNHTEDTSEVLALDTQEFTSTVNPNRKCNVLKTIPETNDMPFSSESQKDLLDEDFQVNRTSKQAPRQYQWTKEKSIENNDNQRQTSAQVKNTVVNDSTSNDKISKEIRKTSEGTLVPSTKKSDFMRAKEASSDSSNNIQDELGDKKKSKNNKRQRETSDSDEINENIKKFWPSKKRGSIEMSKIKQTVPEDTNNANIFKKSVSQKTEPNDNNKNKADEWGFKKSKIKVRNFDLDDIDVDESSKTVKKSKIDIFDSPTKETTRKFDLDDSDVDEPKKIIEQIDNDVPCNSTRLFAKNESAKRNKKAETILEPERDFEFKQIQLKVKPMEMQKKSSFINKNKNIILEDQVDEGKNILSKPLVIKSEINVGGHESSGKVFKKKYNQIPVTRVPLAEMTVWRRN